MGRLRLAWEKWNLPKHLRQLLPWAENVFNIAMMAHCVYLLIYLFVMLFSTHRCIYQRRECVFTCDFVCVSCDCECVSVCACACIDNYMCLETKQNNEKDRWIYFWNWIQNNFRRNRHSIGSSQCDLFRRLVSFKYDLLRSSRVHGFFGQRSRTIVFG